MAFGDVAREVDCDVAGEVDDLVACDVEMELGVGRVCGGVGPPM